MSFAPHVPESLFGLAAGSDMCASDAHDALLLRVLPRVRRRVQYLVRGDEAADLCQEALLRILECLPSYRGDGRFEAWVDSLTTRVTLRALGKRRADRKRLSQVQITPGLRPAPVTSAARSLTQARALDALEQVPTKQRTAILMHYVLGMTVGEVASDLRVPVETIRSRLRVGMAQLRAELGVF
jgi:RNA polymerase sigma-70 factor (ECF subfamily)